MSRRRAAAARHGLAQGARYMEWKVRRDNASARAFYASLAEEHPEVLHVISVDPGFAALAAEGRVVL